MSAGLFGNDEMFSARNIRPWHGLGVVVSDELNSTDALRVAKLDWSVSKRDVFAEVSGKMVKVPGSFATMRDDDNTSLGIVGSVYKPVQNTEAFAFMDDVLANGSMEVKYDTAGSLWGGKVVWMLSRLPNSAILGDDVEHYLFLSNSHDGSGALTCGVTDVRIVCNNTLHMATHSAKRIWKIRHASGSMDMRKYEAAQALSLAVRYQESVEDLAEQMFKVKVDVRQYLEKLFPVAEDVTHKQKLNIEDLRAVVRHIHDSKDDLGNFRGTGWGVYNAVADWLSNTPPARQTSTFAENKMYRVLTGEPILKEAQNLVFKFAA